MSASRGQILPEARYLLNGMDKITVTTKITKITVTLHKGN